MAELAGYGGSFVFGTAVSDTKHNIYSWSLDYKADALDVTGFTDGGDRTYVRGLKGWTVSAEGYVDDTNGNAIATVGSTGTITLGLNGSHNYSGAALCTGFSGPAVKVDGVETITYTFQGLSDLAYT